MATHERAPHPGDRQTHLNHLPAEKVPGLTLEREECLTTAHAIGAATLQVVRTLLEDTVLDRLPTVGRLLRLRQQFGDQRLEAACARALSFDDPAYRTIKRILTQGPDHEPLPDPLPAPEATTFVRTTEELVGDWLEGAPWS